MELIAKINAIISQLEGFKKKSNPNLDCLKDQIDAIENEELLKLDEEFDDWRNSLYDGGEPDEKAEEIIDEICDLFIQADGLINSLREQFGLDYSADDEEDDELVRLLMEEDDEDDEDNDKYVVVLNEISKSALIAIGIESEDSQIVSIMGIILLGISSEESDDMIAGRAFAQMVMSGYILPMDDIKKMCKDTREKCKKQLFGLQIAMNSLSEYNCGTEDVLNQIAFFL